MSDTPCPVCHGHQFVRTADGWTPCECWWRTRLLATIPSLLLGGDRQLPKGVTAKPAPYSVTENRFEAGEIGWNRFRYRAWWSIWSANYHRLLQGQQPLNTIAVELTQLREIEFERDPTFKSLHELVRRADLLLIIGGVENVAPRWLSAFQEIAALAVGIRRVAAKPLWAFNLPDWIKNQPLFPRAKYDTTQPPVEMSPAVTQQSRRLGTSANLAALGSGPEPTETPAS